MKDKFTDSDEELNNLQIIQLYKTVKNINNVFIKNSIGKYISIKNGLPIEIDTPDNNFFIDLSLKKDNYPHIRLGYLIDKEILLVKNFDFKSLVEITGEK